MTKISGSDGAKPTPGADPAGAPSTDGTAPGKPFEEVIGKKGEKGEKGERDGPRPDDRSRKPDEARDAAAKKAGALASRAEVRRPRTVAEWRAMRARQETGDPEKSAETLAQQNPALARPMDVRRPAGDVAGASRVEGLIAKEKIDQIVEKVRIGVNREGATEMQFDMKSKALGGLTLKISTVDGRVYATFLIDQQSAKETVDLNVAQLEKALRDKGLGIGEIKTEMRHGLLPDDQQRGRQDPGPEYDGEAPGSSGGSAGGSAGRTAPEKKPPQTESSTDYVV